MLRSGDQRISKGAICARTVSTGTGCPSTMAGILSRRWSRSSTSAACRSQEWPLLDALSSCSWTILFVGRLSSVANGRAKYIGRGAIASVMATLSYTRFHNSANRLSIVDRSAQLQTAIRYEQFADGTGSGSSDDRLRQPANLSNSVRCAISAFVSVSDFRSVTPTQNS
jgi:hypothetical protein